MQALHEKEILLHPSLEQLADLRKEIRLFLGQIDSSISRNRIVFCLDELVSNVIEHGKLDGTQKKIHIKLSSYPSFWKFILIDEGSPFDPNSIKSESWQELYEIGADGGFGLRAVKKLATLHYRRLAGNTKNQLTLHFRKGSHE
jgi:serine/threonine-protein kinase RsbW